jgi:branched-chain amino acid transport system substrate-binding protein
MRMARSMRVLAATAAVGLLATACGGNLDSAESPADGESVAASAPAEGEGDAAATGTVKIGYVAPLTGPLAAFGEGDQWVVDQMTAYFAENPIQAGGQSYTVDILLKD